MTVGGSKADIHSPIRPKIIKLFEMQTFQAIF